MAQLNNNAYVLELWIQHVVGLFSAVGRRFQFQGMPKDLSRRRFFVVVIGLTIMNGGERVQMWVRFVFHALIKLFKIQ